MIRNSIYLSESKVIYYVYRHIRLDKNEPFYIGIGKVFKRDWNTNSYQSFHNRAFCIQKKRRNNLWWNIFNKTEYKVEILFYSNDLAEIIAKEIELIKLYGRINTKTGTLANLNDGGQMPSWTEEGKKNLSDRAKKRHKEGTLGMYGKMSDKQRKIMEHIWEGVRIPIIQKDLLGNIIAYWESITKASIELKMDASSLSKAVKRKGFAYGFTWERSTEQNDVKKELINQIFNSKRVPIDGYPNVNPNTITAPQQ